ncbi:probable mediator of RNA polymerase II transcription subunit 26b [Euphorbia lathyris]|uniref:probable mediator of RNA polymerase II transcription subunit 26b n=1 Tax=Euphorbia lathyris TaxID=212925 RepID=UPI0033136072
MKSASLDYWRNYFNTANSDIFGIIDHAIMVAASDCPKEFRLHRDRIAERLFSCTLTRCSGCNQVELAVPTHEGENDVGGCKRRDGGNGLHDDDDEGGIDIEAGGSKESKLISSNRDGNNFHGEVNVNDQIPNLSYGEIEALTDEIEEESQVVGEVMRIKDILLNSRDEPDTVLFESLRRLQLMALTMDTLKATEIGKVVNVLRKHGSKQVCNLARTLVNEWKDLVDEWYSAAKPIRVDEGTPESVNPSVVDEEEGLPSPPLDEAYFFTTQTAGIELSQEKFFDGMDDDGNPQKSGEFVKNREKGRKPSMEHIIKRKQQISRESSHVAQDKKSQETRKQEPVVKPSKPPISGSGPGRPLKQKSNNESKVERKIIIQRKASNIQNDKFKCPDEAAVQTKLEATKRKLQERYQQAENAKRQRTIQVMELHDLPKQGGVQKNAHMRPANHNRQWAQGRRQAQ